MTRRVALLRGINVGTAKRIAMADVRALLAELGYPGARTLLNSGNAVFDDPRADADAAAIALRIEAALAERFGFAVPVTVIAADDLVAILATDPFAGIATDPARSLVAFVRDEGAASVLTALAQREWSPERLVAGERAAYLWCPAGVVGGALFSAVDRALGTGVTARNRATLAKLAALARA